MTKTFTAQVSDQTRLVDRRLQAVIKTSAARVIRVAQQPRANGGRMPVKTGFLRNSGKVSLEGMPKGEKRGDPNEDYDWTEADALLVIAQMELGDTLFFGWTANYARYMEAMYGFQRGAAEQWQSIVAEEAARAEALIK